MPLIIAEFLVMAGSFTVLFMILICGIRKDRDDYDSCMRRIRRQKLRKLKRRGGLKKLK